MARKEPTRVQKWTRAHPGLAAAALAIGCAAMLCLVFYFVVFSDFSASADFIYSRF